MPRHIHQMAAMRQHVVASEIRLRVDRWLPSIGAGDDQRLDRIGHRVAVGAVAIPGLERHDVAHLGINKVLGRLQAGVEAQHVAHLQAANTPCQRVLRYWMQVEPNATVQHNIDAFCNHRAYWALNNPHDWALDAQIMMYGTLFMMAGAYTLAKNGHVRGDVLYGFFEPRTQASIDLALYIVFFLPGIVALTWAGWTFANDSLAIREQTFNADPLPIYPFKFVVPVAGAMLLLQGLVEILRCVICLKTGVWPTREEDVEEVDVDKLKEMVHVKDSDIESLDQLVVAQKGGQP